MPFYGNAATQLPSLALNRAFANFRRRPNCNKPTNVK
jgi:hypothetical protein